MKMKTEGLSEDEKKVITAIESGYELLVLVVPDYSGLNDFAAAGALASLKKRGIVAFDGRGNFKSVYRTDEFDALGDDVIASLVAEAEPA